MKQPLTLLRRRCTCACATVALNLLSSVCYAQISTNAAYQELINRVFANQSALYVYLDQDSGFNHGFASGFFGEVEKVHIDAGCIDDPSASNGCSTDSNRLDEVRGTVLRVTFDPLVMTQFAGLNIEEPENWGRNQTGNGYDLSGSTSLTFDVRSPDSAQVQFGMGYCTTDYYSLTPTWQTLTIPLNSFASCTPDLSSVHILFGIATNVDHAPNGGTILLDNIRYEPIPARQMSALGFPFSYQTFGVVPVTSFQTGRVPVPPDQELRNLSTSYESALTEFSFLARGEAEDRQGALLLANTFDYALHHDNHGDPITKGANGSVGVHNGYEDGDIALYNDQIPPKLGKAGDVRLAGFTIGSGPCGSSDFCLVLDGATGGNNAFAILALVRAYEEFQNPQFLSDAETIGTWIISNLTDTSGTGYGGYFVGYDDASNPLQQPNHGKSVENNADIFAALTALSTVTSQLGESEQAADWANAANVAGDFVMRMYDSTNGRFNGGTVPVGTSNDQSEGVCLSSQTQGNDIINVCDFLDSDTFTALAMSSSPRYHNQIDWRVPVQYGWNHFGQGITAGGQTYNGFDIVPTPSAGPNGVAWEFTGQMCAAMEFVDQIYNDTRFQSDITQCISDIAQAQSLAPFGDQLGLVASTMQDGDTLPPIDQCLSTAFQCIPERVALAATNWAIFAKTSLNAFLLPPIGFINIPGALQQISVGFDGTVWGINSSQQIYMYNTQTQSFQQAPGDLMHVAVGSNGAVWGVNSSEQVFRYDSSIQSWDFISSGNLASIAVGADGDVWGLNSAQQIFHFDTTTQSFQEIPGDLAQIAVGFDGAVWGVNSSGQVYRFNPGTQSFEQVPGIMTQIAVGVDGDVWALNNSNGTVYHFDRLSQNWDQIAGTLAQISVGAGNNVWGLDSSGNVFQFNNQMGNFEQVAGNLSQISAGENGAVWGVNSAGQIFEFTGPTQATGTLHQLPGALTQIAVGVDGNVWGLNSAGQIYAFNPLIQSWNEVPGSFSQIAMGFGGNVWALNSAGQISQYDPSTQSWNSIPGSLAQIAVGANGDVWGLNSSNQIYRYDTSIQSWDSIPGALAQIAVGADGAVWGLNSSSQIYRYDPSIQSWDSIPGDLAQIEVGSSANVWGLNSVSQIWRYDTTGQTWDEAPGDLARISVAFDGAVWGVNSSDQVFRYDPGIQSWDSISGSLSQIQIGSDAAIWGLDSTGSIYRYW